MKDFHYALIVIIPAFVCVAVSPFIVYVVGRNDETRRERFTRWFVTNLFSGIIKKKTTNRDETRWLFKDIDLTEERELRTKVFLSFLRTFYILIGSVVIMFWQILLLDVTYSCEPNSESTKDCFEYNLWNSENFKTLSRDPIDCNSAAVQNGTVQVVCYKLVFNIGLAYGTTFGGFQLSVAVLNVATTLMLMATNQRTVRRVRTIVFIAFFVFCGIILTIQFTLRVTFSSGNLVIMLQMLLVLAIVYTFVFWFPWDDFIALRERENEQATGLENVAENVI